MLWLPNPQAHESVMAVADRSALVLERALLSDHPDAAAGELAEAMLGDAWLVVWVDLWHSGPPQSIGQLALWWVERAREWVERLSCHAPEPCWQGVEESHAWGLAAAAINTPRWIDPAHCREWRLGSPDYVIRVTQSLRESPQQGWLDEGDSEYKEYLAVDRGVGWRLPRVVAHLRKAWGLERAFADRLQRAKLDALKELAYGASHEINNPLANISGRAQMLLRDERDPQRRRMLMSIDAQAMRAHEMISDLMHYARPAKLCRERVGVAGLVSQVIEEVSNELAVRQITTEVVDLAPNLAIEADVVQFQVALRALFVNSMESIGSGGKIKIEVSHGAGEEGKEQMALLVADTGRGIPDSAGPHLFDPFFSGREAGRGLGFGLSKAWRIVTDHGGKIEVAACPEYATAFRIWLPLPPDETLQ